MTLLSPTRGRRATPSQAPTDAQESGRRRVFALVGVLAVWVAGWALLKGRQNLELAVSTQTDLHRWLLDVRDRVEAARTDNFFLDYVVGGVSSALDWGVEFLQQLFSQPAFPRPVPEIGWLGVVALAVFVAYALAGARIAVLVAVSMLAFGLLGYWEESIDLLIVTGVAVGICVLIGLPLGIWMSRSDRTTAVVTPVLDVMQTMPAFAYLAPLVLFFGIGPASAVVTTLIYALPPLVRISAHGLRSVSPTTLEATTSLGSTSRQLLAKVQLPMARRTVIVGLNQTTMAAL
ncbi:MAG: ABC transporter permease subunit, partial [Actinomycetota bacterium]|nr:ABC transporter permease subunit [Actinomycetota bacterium]